MVLAFACRGIDPLVTPVFSVDYMKDSQPTSYYRWRCYGTDVSCLFTHISDVKEDIWRVLLDRSRGICIYEVLDRTSLPPSLPVAFSTGLSQVRMLCPHRLPSTATPCTNCSPRNQLQLQLFNSPTCIIVAQLNLHGTAVWGKRGVQLGGGMCDFLDSTSQTVVN